jgi:nucleotide-binding universal stress UspA family protein
MFKKILFPTDFSDLAARALEFVIQLKNSGAEEIIVLHVLDDKYFYFLDESTAIDFEKFEKDLKRDAMNKLTAVANKLNGSGFKVKVMIARGAPVSEILKVERDEDVSIIVLGSHGISNLKEMFLGSVSESVIRKSPQPVLVVKRESHV